MSVFRLGAISRDGRARPVVVVEDRVASEVERVCRLDFSIVKES